MGLFIHVSALKRVVSLCGRRTTKGDLEALDRNANNFILELSAAAISLSFFGTLPFCK